MKKGTLLALGLGLGAVALMASSNKSSTTSPSKPMVENPIVVPSNPQTPVTVTIPGQAGTITVSQNDPSFDGKMTYTRDPLPHPFNS